MTDQAPALKSPDHAEWPTQDSDYFSQSLAQTNFPIRAARRISGQTTAHADAPALSAPSIKPFEEPSLPVYLSRAPEVSDALTREFRSEEWLQAGVEGRKDLLFSTFNKLNASFKMPDS